MSLRGINVASLSGGGGISVNEETLSANKTIADGDPIIQILDPNSTNRDVTLPATPSEGSVFEIFNAQWATGAAGGTYLDVKISGIGAAMMRIYAGSSAKFVYENSNWVAWGHGQSVKKNGVSFEAGAKLQWGPNSYTAGAGAFSLAMGVSATATGPNSIAIGSCGAAGSSSISMGNVATASGLAAVSLGQSSASGGSYQSNIGYQVTGSTRWGAGQIGVFPKSSLSSKCEQVGWVATTTNATITEALMDTERFTMAASSRVGFEMQVVAREAATNDCKYWTVSGAIKRDGSNNTALVGSVTKTVVGADAGASAWDVTVDANDTNETLRVQVTGEAAHTISWSATARILDRR